MANALLVHGEKSQKLLFEGHIAGFRVGQTTIVPLLTVLKKIQKNLLLPPGQKDSFSPRSRLRLFLKHSMLLSLMKAKLLSMSFLTNSLNLLILLNASVSLLVPSSSLVAPDKFEAPKLDKSKAKKRFKTCH